MQGKDLPPSHMSLKPGGAPMGQTDPPQPSVVLGGILQLACRVPVQAERLLWFSGCVIKGHVRNVPEAGKRGRKPRKLLTYRSANCLPPHPLALPGFFSVIRNWICFIFYGGKYQRHHKASFQNTQHPEETTGKSEEKSWGDADLSTLGYTEQPRHMETKGNQDNCPSRKL